MKKNPSGSSGNVLKVDPRFPSPDILKKAVTVLRQGGVVAIPTDTYYGLAGDVFNERALKKIYKVKGRDESKPLLVIIPDSTLLPSLTSRVSGNVQTLISRFWPGPLTMLFPGHPRLPRLLVGRTQKIGIRIPDHPVALALLKACKRVLTATSANRTGQPGPVTAEEVTRSIGKDVDLILDAGPTAGGKGSTIVDITLSPPRLVREGKVPFSTVMELLGITLTDEHDW